MRVTGLFTRVRPHGRSPSAPARDIAGAFLFARQ